MIAHSTRGGWILVNTAVGGARAVCVCLLVLTGGLGALSGPLLARASAQAPPSSPAPPSSAGDPAAPTESMEQATTTEADMTEAQARSHFRLGRSYYELGKFAEAAAEFEVAHGLSGRPELLYNVYLAYRDAQEPKKAADALRGYLAQVQDVNDREHLQARLTALDRQVAEAEAEQQRRAAQAAQASRDREAAERRARAAEARANLRPERPWWPWLVVGGGAALAVGGLVVGVLAASDGDELRADCVANPRTDGSSAPLVSGGFCAPSVELEDRRSGIQSQALLGDVLWISGATVGVTGLVLAFALPDEYPDQPPLSAGCSGDGCRAALRVRF